MIFPKLIRTDDRALLDSYRYKICDACGRRPPCDPAHIRSKGAGGPDEVWNLMALCRACHSDQHRVGIITFIEKNPGLAWRLKAIGWVVNKGKLWNPRLANPSKF